MAFELTSAMEERPRKTIEAAEILHRQARGIARACTRAQAGQIVVAVVEPDLRFGGLLIVPAEQLGQRVAALGDGGWSLVFARGTRRDEIEARCLIMARQAFTRWEALRRWASRHT